MATVSGLIKKFLIAVIKIYQFAISTLLGPCGCRFQPSCSAYTLEAIKQHGCVKGCFLGVQRIMHCHPWHPGGVDPVPKNKY